MTLKLAIVCSNCGRKVSEGCDGRVYRSKNGDFARLVCKGSSGTALLYNGETVILRQVIGLGHSEDYELEEVN